MKSGTFGQRVVDSFVNFAARLGWGADNQFSGSRYDFNFMSRDRVQLEAMYRTSWLVGQAVDVPAEDMTRAGIEITSTMAPDDIDALQRCLRERHVWQAVAHTVRWSRLFGGAIAVMLIDGQDTAQPLRPETVGPGAFKGLLVLDRWMVEPSLNDLVTELGPDLGMPKFYTVVGAATALANQRIHHSRVLRLDGIELPFYQRMTENGWGESVIERLHDRLVAFDSTSQGAAQLVYKAHLRVVKIEKLRELIALGGKAMESVAKELEMIRLYQSNEGLTVLDSTDDFATHQYTFSGLSDVLLQFGQQLSGALGIPLVRLFGQSPAGLNSTGESDLRTYYDNINQQQEAKLRAPVGLLLEVVSWSELHRPLPDDFGFEFAPLWQMSDLDKATVTSNVTTAVTAAVEAGIVTSRATALKELRQIGRVTGIWTNITDQDITEAETDPPLPPEGEDVPAITPELTGTKRAQPEAPHAVA